MTDLLILVTALVWVPLIPLRLALQAGIDLWRRLGDGSFWIFFAWWAAADILVLAQKETLLQARFDPIPFTAPAGSLISLAALAFGYWTARTLGFITLSTRPQIRPEKATATLIITGPYRYLRHPFYLGEWFLLAGLTLATSSWVPLILLGFTLVVDPIVTLFEERELTERFGDDYREYQKKVPRLIPRPGASQ